ncbi:MAG: hypothetical protein AABX70_04560 [Nanoarchaeota archaeon]
MKLTYPAGYISLAKKTVLNGTLYGCKEAKQSLDIYFRLKSNCMGISEALLTKVYMSAGSATSGLNKDKAVINAKT